MKLGNSPLLLISFLSCGLLFGCNNSSNQGASSTSGHATAKHYKLKGQVVSIDKRGKMVNVDGEAIPGFMDAMTMPYQVKPESELDKLQPGDRISADLVVQEDNAWLENVRKAP